MTDRPEPVTLFERCVEAAGAAGPIEVQVRTVNGNSFAREITRAVLTTLRAHTPSLRTAEEIDRILAEPPQ